VAETPSDFAKRLGIPIQLAEYERTYGQLFPADNPLSPLMLRLMIIRDDLDFEMNGIMLRDEDGLERVWQNTYFMRRISSSVCEAQNVLRQLEFGTFVKEQWKRTVVDVKVKEVTKELGELNDLLGPELGGHVRPGELVVGLRTHKDWKAVIVRNLASSYATTYRRFTMISPMFVWQEVVDQATYAAKHEALASAVPRAVGALLPTLSRARD